MKSMKRMIALLLALMCVVTALAACGQKAENGAASSIDQSEGSNKIKLKKPTEAEKDREADTKTTPKDSKLAKSFSDASDVSYVMVYNPDVYDEYNVVNSTLSTGKLSEWIDTSANRADGLGFDSELEYASQKDLFGDAPGEQLAVEQNRAGALAPTYKEGDTHEFFYSENLDGKFAKGVKFTCVKAGKKCYVWMLDKDKSKKSEAEKIAKEFDEKIYDKDTSLYGSARFAEDGGKVNLLFHPMNGSLMGYFSPLELFTSDEITELARILSGIDAKRTNTDHAIVHINSAMLGNKEFEEPIKSTVAHEFQHLINFTSSLEGGYDLNRMNTWLNEALSGYIEEALYPGVQEKELRYPALEYSDLIRNGQSLFNFETDVRNKDIGVYGSVFLFSEYLSKASGEKTFKKLHDAWRSRKIAQSAKDDYIFTTAESLYKSVSDTYKKSVDSLVDYPSSYSFYSKEEEWMSKMALDFYLSLMKFEKTDPKVYENVHVERLLYDQINAAEIEGGGRIVFATKDGKFSIPSDADSNLVYVGFDKDFNRVTDIICK